MINWLKNKITNSVGRLIGWLGMIGFRYPVKHYMFKVSDNLYRGSRLNAGRLAGVLDIQCRMIVNLCAEAYTEARYEKLSSIPITYIPVIDNTPPKTEQMVEFLNLTLDPKNQPVYVHCEAGKGRTGIAVACYRMAINGWEIEKALAEAKQFGMGMPSQEKFLREFYQDIKDGKIELTVYPKI